MSKKDEALKLALEALEYIYEGANNQGPHTGISWRCVSKKAAPVITALRQALANEALDKKAENARELGLDYEPSAGTQVSKVWWDGEKLMAKQVPLEDFYKPAQQEPVSFLDWYDNAHWGNEDFKAGCRRAWNAALAQRTWVGLTDEEWQDLSDRYGLIIWGTFKREIEAKLREKNT